MNVAELLTIPSSMFPEQEILRDRQVTLTYEVLADRAARMAGALLAEGVRPGDRVACMQTNTAALVELLYATVGLGAVFVPVSYRAREDELAHMLGVAQPRVLAVGERYLALARAAAGGDTRVLLLEDEPGGTSSLAAAAERAESIELPAVESEDSDLAVLLFTSGTTAAAKAVMLEHGALTSFVFNTTEAADGEDRGAVLIAAPLYHVAGLTAVLAATFGGRRMVLQPQFEAGEWLRLVEAETVTHAFLVPTMLKRVLDHPTFGSTDLASLQVLSYGAAPMPPRVVRQAIERLPASVQLINAFGQTETTSTVTMLGPDDHRLEGTPAEVELKLRRLSSIGRPLPDVEIRIVDEMGQEVPPGTVGEIAIRTERAMRGYYGQTDATSATVQDGWLRTRDLGWVDEGGYVFLAGRRSDLVIRGGENIAPDEVELVLESHPAVEEAAVIGIPDDEWGERVGAVVVVREGAAVEVDELVEHCRERLASFKKPEHVFFTDALPRNAMGKLVRSELRARFARGQAEAAI